MSKIIATNVSLEVVCSNCDHDKFLILKGEKLLIYQCMECGYPNLKKELIIKDLD